MDCALIANSLSVVMSASGERGIGRWITGSDS